MKRTIKKILFVACILLLSSSSNIYAQAERPVDLKDLKQLSENIDKESVIEKKIFSMGYHKTLNKVYISNAMLTEKRPKHWIRTSVYLTFATADKASWDRILNELKKEGKPKKFNTGTSDIGYRYAIPNYNVEVYKPINGVNLNLNSLYEVVMIPKRK